MSQKEFLTNLCEENKEAVIVGSLGTISYDLKDIPHNRKILVKGAMGGAMGVGLGYVMNTKRDVIVVVGDGAFLMKMGCIATIKRYAPRNFRVIIINNGCFRSCGKQESNFAFVKDIIPFEVVDVA